MRFDLCRDMIASGRAIAIARGVGEDEAAIHESAAAQQPVVKVWPHSTGDASFLHPNAAAASGTPALAALLLPQILPVLPPHRANDARRGPRFSVVAPCQTGASPLSVRRQTFTM